MKRALPLLLKYFAVVGIACFLAYFISHTIASAAVPGVVAAVANAIAHEPASYASPGAYRIETSLGMCGDDSGAREIPVEIDFPVVGFARNGATTFPVVRFSHGMAANREGEKLGQMK